MGDWKSPLLKIIVSPDVNPPEPFPGFGGYCGWPTVCRLQNGDLFVTFSAGYWYASWPTPWDIPAADKERFARGAREWLADWNAPEGGRMMWIRSRDQGKTWVKPAPGRGFKCDPKSYYPSACVLEDGSIFMVGQREGFKNRFGPHGAEVTSVRFRINRPGEEEGVELLPIGGPS